MGERRIKIERVGYSDAQIVSQHFPTIWARRFWAGVAVGVLLMALADFTDVWICVGECGGSDIEILPK